MSCHFFLSLFSSSIVAFYFFFIASVLFSPFLQRALWNQCSNVFVVSPYQPPVCAAVIVFVTSMQLFVITVSGRWRLMHHSTVLFLQRSAVNVLPEVDSGTHRRLYACLTLNLTMQRKYQSISHPHVFDAGAIILSRVTRIRKWEV